MKNFWIIYDHPADNPSNWVAKQWEADFELADVRETGIVIVDELQVLRDKMQSEGMTLTPRYHADDPAMFEVWI